MRRQPKKKEYYKGKAARICILSSVILAAFLVFSLAAAAPQDDVTLSISFRGLRLNALLQWQTVPLGGSFEVMAGDTLLGVVAANMTPEQASQGITETLTIKREDASAGITLRPKAESIPEAYTSPDSIPVTLGSERSQRVDVIAYAREGLFRLNNVMAVDGQPAGGADFAVLDAGGQKVLSFSTDNQGSYSLASPLKAGTYTLCQTLSPEETIPASDVLFEVTPYFGSEDSIAVVTMVNEPVPVMKDLIEGFKIETIPAGNLYAADQTADFVLKSNIPEGNALPLDNVIINVDKLELTDEEGNTLPDQTGKEFGSITVIPGTEGIAAYIKIFDEQGNQVGNERLLTPGQALDLKGLGGAAAQIEYKAVSGQMGIPAGFVPGEIRFRVNMLRRAPDMAKASAAYVKASFGAKWSYQYEGRDRRPVLASGQSDAISLSARVLDNRASLNVSAEALDAGRVALTIRHEGGPSLENLRLAVQLPDGWRVMDSGYMAPVLAVSRGADADIMILSFIGTLAKGQEQRVEFSASVGTGVGTGGYYVQSTAGISPTLDNPKGLMIRGIKQDECPVADALLGLNSPGIYAYGTWTAQSNAQHGLSLQAAGFAQHDAKAALPAKGDATLLLDAAGKDDWYAVILPQGVRLLGVSKSKSYVTTDTTPQRNSVWVDSETYKGDMREVTALSLQGGQAVRLYVSTDVKGETVEFITLSITENGETFSETQGSISIKARSTAALHGRLFDDANGNGKLDENESGAAGQLVFWQADKMSFHTYTNSQGAFDFSGAEASGIQGTLNIELPDNALILDQTVSGNLTSYPQINLNEAKELLISYRKMGAVHGKAHWHDSNEGLPGIEVTLLSDGKKIGNAITDANGEYRFDALPAGEYLVSAKLPDVIFNKGGFYSGDGYDAIEGMSAALPTVTMPYGGDMVLDMPIRRIGSLNATVAGYTYPLGKAALQMGGSTVYEAEPRTDGSYLFERLLEGNYTFTVAVPEGLAARAAGTQSWQKDSISFEIAVTAGESTQLKLEETVTGRLTVSFDNSSLMGSSVTISGPEMLSAVLDGSGRILYSNLLPGTYLITAILPDSVLADQGGIWQISAGQDGAIATMKSEVKPGEEAIIQTTSLVQTADVSGVVYDDANLDNKLGAGEAAVEGVLVDLYAMRDNTWEKVGTATTGPDGAYRFNSLTPGQYHASIVLPEGKALADLKAVEPFALTSGQSLVWDAGVIAPATLSVNAFWDSSNDGEQGTYERAIEGVLAEVIPADSDTNTVIAQAYTNYTGMASFESLAPGKYVIRFTLPEEYWISSKGSEIGLKYNAVDMADSRQGVTAPFTLAQGIEQGIGVGGIKTGLISGRIWLDENQNGIMDENEPGLSGVNIALSGAKNGLNYSYITDDTGLYQIIARTDTYVMTVQGPEEMTFTRSSATGGVKRSIFTLEGTSSGQRKYLFESGTKEIEQNIGMVPSMNLSGIAFLDANYNGAWDAGEPPLEGAAVELSTAADKTLGSVTTSADGAFRFISLRGGQYNLRAVLPADTGIVFSKISEGGEYGNLFAKSKGKMDSTVILLLTSGEDRMVGVGAVMPGSLSGGVFEDENYNGLYDAGEKPVSGVAVRLIDPDGNTAESMVTNADGTFTFDALMPMSYIFGVEKPVGWMFTKQVEGESKSRIVSIHGDEGVSDGISMALGQRIDSVYAGIIPPANVSGQVFGDENDDGLVSDGESGFEGVQVTLLDEAGQEVTSLVTGADGTFAFNDLHPGMYALRYDLPEETVFAKTVDGGNLISGDGLAAAGEIFRLSIGESKQAPLCGAVALGRITGVAFHDINANGMYEDEEGLLEGVELSLTDKSSGQIVYQIVTGKNGIFAIERLRPGSYMLSASLPDAMIFTRESEESLMPVSLQSQGSVDLKMSMGQRLDHRLIGGTKPASIAGQVWLDENNNGFMEPEETLLGGLTVMLTEALSESQYARLDTDENGAFVLPVVHPGSYDITVDLPQNCIAASREAGDNQFVDSALGKVSLAGLSVAEGEAVVGIRAGIRQYTSIAGTVWADEQGKMVPLGAANVYLYNSGDLSAPLMSSITVEDGAYKFDELMPGDYCIAAQLPDGYLFVKPQDERLISGQAVSVISDTAGGFSSAFKLDMGKDLSANDIGAVKTGSLGDIAWLDENKNGLQDAGELGIPGLPVALLQDGIEVAKAVTDEYGYYLFENLYPMNSQVRVDMYPELLPTAQSMDFPLLSSVIAGYEGTVAYTGNLPIYSGGRNFDCDLGFVLKDGAKRPDVIQQPPTQKWD